LRAFAQYVDTVKLQSAQVQSNPPQVHVSLTVLNEVAESRSTGGSNRTYIRDKPQLLIASHSRDSMKKAMKAIGAAYAKASPEEEKNKYDKITLFADNAGPDNSKLGTVIDMHLNKKKEERAQPRRTPRTFEDVTNYLYQQGRLHFPSVNLLIPQGRKPISTD
jgi:hypothetical protein